MDNIKLSVTFELPGSQMLTSQECEENPKTSYNHETIVYYTTVKYKDGKKTKFKNIKESINIQTRKFKPAKQSINMTREAYDAMISTSPIEGIPPSTWKKMSKTEKICAHLDKIKSDLNATKYSFSILDD